jgi:DNA-binding NarL/FixJ family response regulator
MVAAPRRVMIADDQDLVRSGLRMILETAGVEVVAEAVNGDDAVRYARLTRPDVVLMDVRMPIMDGVEATRLLAGPDVEDPVRVLVLTMFDEDEQVDAALRAGARGFLLKDTPPEQLVAAIEAVCSGGAVIAPSTTARLIPRLTSTPALDDPAALDGITPREHDVLRLVAAGLNNSEIAEELTIEVSTVKTHVSSLLSKLDVRDREQLIVFVHTHLTP